MAEAVGVSRSALVERFSRYLSEPPMVYLTRWRLQLAAQALTSTSRGVAEIPGVRQIKKRRLAPFPSL